jgi:hypothetical protein
MRPRPGATAQIRNLSARLGAEWAAAMANHGLLNASRGSCLTAAWHPRLSRSLFDLLIMRGLCVR